MFVEAGWAVADRGAFAVDAQRRADQRDAVDHLDGLHAELVGEGEGLVDLVDRAGGDLGLAQERRASARRAAGAARPPARRRTRRRGRSRAVLVAKRSSEASSGSPTTAQSRANMRSLPTAMASGRSAVS